MGISVETSGVLFADAFVLVADRSGINFASTTTNPSAGGTQRGPCLQQVTTRAQCDEIVDSVFNRHTRPLTNFTAIAIARGGNIAVPGFLGGDRLLFCTLALHHFLAAHDGVNLSTLLMHWNLDREWQIQPELVYSLELACILRCAKIRASSSQMFS